MFTQTKKILVRIVKECLKFLEKKNEVCYTLVKVR